MSNEVCPPPLFPETLNCSGIGTCVSEFECECPPGYSGAGDFAFKSPSCSVLVSAVQPMWGVLAGLYMIQLVVSLRYIHIKSQQARRTNSPLVLGFLWLFNAVMFVTLGLLKATDPYTRVIGTDPATTTLFSLGAGSFWVMVHIFTYSFIELQMRQSRMSAHREEDMRVILRTMRMELPFSALVCSIACAMPFFMLLSTSPETTFALGACHYLLLGFELGFTGLVLVPRYIDKVVEQIQGALKSSQGNKHEQLKKVVSKILRFKLELRNQAVSNLVLAILFGSWPFLQVYGSSYFLAIAWFSGVFVNGIAMWVHFPVAQNNTSSNGDSSQKSSAHNKVANVASPDMDRQVSATNFTTSPGSELPHSEQQQ